MSSLAPVFNILARIMVGYAALLLVPMAWAWQLDAPAMVDVWLYSMAITLVLGLTLWLLTSRFHRELMPRDVFLLVNLVWTVLPACSAIPLVLAIDGLSWTDAYFETMSGLTATGSTVISGLDALPVSVN